MSYPSINEELVMNIKLLILLSLFSISLAYAHPNHMTFEDIQHNTAQIKSASAIPDKLTHTAIEEKHGHGNAMPCTQQQQHKTVPCKKD